MTPYRYAEDPDFAFLMVAWAVDDGPVQVAFTREEINGIPYRHDPDTLKVAHNAAFERICFSRQGRRSVGSYLPPEEWHDTMAIAGEKGYPQSLGKLAVALGVEEKDEAGTALINWFCKPDRNGNFRRPEDHPEKWQRFVEYCRQDVVTLRAVHRKLGGWPNHTERSVYHTDQRINDRGMRLDLELAAAAETTAEDNRLTDELEISAITGVANPGSRDQLMAWFRERSDQEERGAAAAYPGAVPFDHPNDLQAATVEKLLQQDLPGDVRRVLELRQGLALVAAKKFTAGLLASNSDGRMRGGFRFFGAHTGRWAGKGVQPHNFPREQLATEAETSAAILDVKMGLGADALTLKALVRPMIMGPLTVVDYAAIEARVISWLAGEQWALDAFNDGRDIYVETAGRMGPQYSRRHGKVAVLALGYNGGVNSLRALGATGTDDELQGIVNTWRSANQRIVRFWKDLETAFRSGGPVGEHLRVESDGGDRAIVLPSGRSIVYHDVHARWKETQYGRKLGLDFQDPRTGFRTSTYGGRLSENVTQAVARDVLAEALVRLEARGYPVVGHVHDEVLVEGSDVPGVTAVMTESPPWAGGLPIAAEGDTCDRYRKM